MQFDAFEPPPRDEVDDSRDCLRSVDGRGAVLEDFHAFDCQHGNQGGKVHETRTVVGLRGGQDLPPAVQQDQRGRDAEPAQINVGGADRVVLGQVIGVVFRAGVDGEHADQVANVPEPGVEQGLPVVI